MLQNARKNDEATTHFTHLIILKAQEIWGLNACRAEILTGGCGHARRARGEAAAEGCEVDELDARLAFGPRHALEMARNAAQRPVLLPQELGLAADLLALQLAEDRPRDLRHHELGAGGGGAHRTAPDALDARQVGDPLRGEGRALAEQRVRAPGCGHWAHHAGLPLRGAAQGGLR